MKELLGVNTQTRKKDYWLENAPGEWALHSVQDVEPTLDLVRDLQDAQTSSRAKDMQLVAEIPLVFIDQAMREGWFFDRDAWRKFLNSYEMRRFRVWQGRL